MGENTNLLTKLVDISNTLDTISLTNMEATLTFDIDGEDYDEIFNFFQTKYKKIIKKPKSEFSIMVGKYKVIFNKNNV